jgi:hypothetical protein
MISVISLISVNLVPLFGVIFWKWSLFAIMFLYWSENVVIGILNAAKMFLICTYGSANPKNAGLTGGQSGQAGSEVKGISGLFLIPFFLVHYGIFTAVHGVFIFVMFGPADVPFSSLAIGFISLFISHGLSFLFNFIGKKEYLTASLGLQMFQPYIRVIVMHITILFGGFIAKAIGAPIGALFILIAIKTGIDLISHRKEHRTPNI